MKVLLQVWSLRRFPTRSPTASTWPWDSHHKWGNVRVICRLEREGTSMRRVPISLAALSLGALACAAPAWAGLGSCPPVQNTDTIYCNKELPEGGMCYGNYWIASCWGYGSTSYTCTCGMYVDCCGDQYVTYHVEACVPGSQCVGGCGERSRSGKAIQLASRAPRGKRVLASEQGPSRGVPSASQAHSTSPIRSGSAQ